MQITHSEKHVSDALCKLRTDNRPLLNPTIERRPQEWKRSLCHLAMLFLQQFARDVRLLPHPPLVRICGFDDIAHISVGSRMKGEPFWSLGEVSSPRGRRPPYSKKTREFSVLNFRTGPN